MIMFYLLESEGIVGNEGQHGSTSDDVLDLEGIKTRIVCSLELDLHQVDDIKRGGNEEDLHRGVVDGQEVGEEIKVTRQEDGSIQSLCLERDACWD